jgi:hypothetical protein
MVLLPESATKRLPAPSTATPGLVEAGGGPRAVGASWQICCVPASVVATPVGVIFRMVLL